MRATQRADADIGRLGNGSTLMNVKPFCKEASQKWLYGKANWIWKLIILAVLGLSGMYICLSGVERRFLYLRRVHGMTSDNEAEIRSLCLQSKTSVPDSLAGHYPQPLTFDRKDCSCTPVHYFVVFSMQRSGSGWFETLLNSHPNVSSHGEVFSVERRRTSVSTIKETLNTIYNLDWVSSAAKNECTAAVGLKWMLNQGVMEYKTEIAAYLKEKSVSVIFLFRRNLLRRYVSILANAFDRDAKQLNGTHRAHVHSEVEAEVLAAYKPVVNLASLLPYLERVGDIINDARISFKHMRHMTLFYEDLVGNPQKELKRAQKFLSVKVTKLESKHVKIHTRPLNDQIGNWSDLSEFLKQTKYKALLTAKDYK